MLLNCTDNIYSCFRVEKLIVLLMIAMIILQMRKVKKMANKKGGQLKEMKVRKKET